MGDTAAKKEILRARCIAETDFQITQLRESVGATVLFFFEKQIATARANAVRQVDIVLTCAAHGGDCRCTELAAERAAYEAHDVYAPFYNAKHPRFGELRELMVHHLSARITVMRELLSGEGVDYDGLVRSRFGSRDDALVVLRKELDESARVVSLVEREPKLVKLPFGVGAHKAVEAMRKYLDFSQSRLRDELDRIYGGS